LKGGKGGKGKVRGHSKGGAAAREEDAAEAPAVYFAVDGDDDEVMDVDPPVEAPPADIPPPSTDIDSHPSRSFVPDMAPVRATEKRRLDFRGKLYLAPLTTVGNLPFRRLCGDYGNDISCSEMGLAQEFMNGNASEWSLVRKHPSEKMFGIQVCGSRPQTLVPTAEALVKACDVDFLGTSPFPSSKLVLMESYTQMSTVDVPSTSCSTREPDQLSSRTLRSSAVRSSE
jgi:tRNA-dihydrouridine synthase 3